MIQLQTTSELSDTADLTLTNMSEFYKRYNIRWTREEIVSMVNELDNYRLMVNGEEIGVVRLSQNNGQCLIRDFQIKPEFQGKGFGSRVLDQITDFAKEKGLTSLWLKVFKVSRAVEFYKNNDFYEVCDDDRFYFLQRDVI